MIRVKLKLSGLMVKYYKTSPKAKMEYVDIPEGSTVGNLVDSYSIPRSKVHMVVLNNKRVNMDAVLRDGDEVWALPLAHGG